MLGFLFFLSIVCTVSILLLLLKLYVKFITGWCYSQTCLNNKTAIVTGANTGIGYETALDFAKRGAKVILACRDFKKGEEARLKIIQQTDNTDVFLKLVDFNSLKSVRAFAKSVIEEEKRLDILVNNAGTIGVGNVITADGFPFIIQVNYLAPFLLTILLLDLLKKSGFSRIVNVSSIAAKYTPFDVFKLLEHKTDLSSYAKSKLCNILFTRELAEKLKGTNVTTYSAHPGAVATDVFRGWPKVLLAITNVTFKYLFKSPLEGAQTSIYLSVEKNIEKLNGEHFHDCHHVKCYKTASDKQLAKKLWRETEDIVKLEKYEKQF